jgi:hypothetical protein
MYRHFNHHVMYSRATHRLAFAVLAVTLVLTCNTERAGPTDAGPWTSVTAGRKQVHIRPTWAAPIFKEPIQGVKVADRCTFPSYNEVSKKHRGLVRTVGEYDTATCAGVMYFGDWAKELRKLEQDAEARGAKADTASARTVRPR